MAAAIGCCSRMEALRAAVRASASARTLAWARVDCTSSSSMSSSALSAETTVAAEADGTATAAPPPLKSPQRPCAAAAAAAIGCLGDGRGGPSIDDL